MKKAAWVLVAIILLMGSVVYYRHTHRTPTDPTISRYSNSELGISFSYPNILAASTTDGTVTVHHDIAYENTGDCDMKGIDQTFPRLTDFEMTLRVFDTGLVKTMKTQSPYIPEENFINGEVVPSPGFIDPYTAGTFKGYAIYEGAEGCGQTAYYFPLGSSRTLLVTKASIQQLSTAASPETRTAILAVPGVISPEESDKIFSSIMKSIVVQ